MSAHNPPALVLARSISPQWRALHALHCCKVVRASVGDEEFSRCVERGFALRLFTGRGVRPGQCDYFITPKGREWAYELF